ncbi:MAG: DUF6572 domain-containing protein [Eubacteriaceae bacterium]
MSVIDTNKIDGMGISKDGKKLILLITDHLDWNNEYDHLSKLQEKINSYIGFLENKQYNEIYPDKEFSSYFIEVHFKYEISDNCSKFIKVISKQLLEQNIFIEAFIDEGN